jgi:hypothetical protein
VPGHAILVVISLSKRPIKRAANGLKPESHMNKNTKNKKSSSRKSSAKVKDLKPKKNPKGGIGLLVPAVQKVREAAGR